MYRSTRVTLGFLFVIFFCAAPAAFAQGSTGQLSGNVVDANGAVVSGANIKLTSRATAQERETITNDSGDFAFTLLPAGDYKLEITASGFRTVLVEQVRVNVTQTTTLPVRLDAATVTEMVTIQADAPLVQQETSQVGRTIQQETIRQLPLPTRNFQQLLTLSPGTSSSVANNTELGRGDAIISVNGQRTTSNNVRINGIDANSIGTNSTPNIAVPATDTLQEFIVQTSLYDASQGRNAGGNVEAVTKAGSNEFHGNAYYFLRNSALNANDFFLNSAGRPRPVLNRHQFGGTLGGPILEDRLFFFASYQGTREQNGASLNNSLMFPFIPLQLRDNNRTAAGLAAAFGLPVASINPVIVNVLNARLPNGQFAIPSAATATGLTPISGLSRFRENQFNANFDWRLSDNHTISSKNFFASNPTVQANFNFAGLGNGITQLPGTGGSLDIIQDLNSITDTYVFSPNVVNQARFGFSRLRVTSVAEEPFTAAEFGINSPLRNLFPGMPTLTVTGLFTLGSSPFADQSSRINAFTFGDTLSVVSGDHRLRFGGEYRRSQVNFYFNAFSRGQVIFSSFNNFLIGNGVSIIGSGVFDRALRVNDWSGFVQDDWKVNSRLTFNLGLRYDFYGYPVDTRGRLVNFLPDQFRAGTTAAPAGPPNGFVQAGNGTLAGVPTVEDTLIPNDKNNFSPRVGFAFRLNDSGSLVVRGGYGIYYDRLSTRYANTQLLNYPYLALAVGLPGILRTMSDPFIPVPQPGAFPVNPTIPSPLAPLAPIVGVPISGIFIDPELRTPYIQQYNTNVQWEFAKDFLLELGYVGSKGTKLLQVITLNQPVYNRAANVFTAPFGTALSTQKNVAGGIQQAQSSSNSDYNSLQLSVTKRFSRGLQFLSAYTYGKSNDYYSGGTINELFAVAGDQFDWRTNYGPSDFDRRHRFVTSFVYDVPKLVSDSNSTRVLLNNWQLNGILTLQSGTPFSIVDIVGNNIIQRANFASGFTGGIETSGDTQSRLNGFFNTAAFALSRPILAGTNLGTPNNPTFDPNNPFGNTSRNLLYGPGQKNMDFSVVKFIPIRESIRGEFRTEFFNLFNWANFANPNNNIAVPSTFGRITATSAGPRVIQFAFKLNF
ncbi:MAG TPA: TonB-dependent receptor [Pyrinomonadaceae bacterium]|nr:TonB-dependent receptor [Pyrinomonadaceae bacterium]